MMRSCLTLALAVFLALAGSALAAGTTTGNTEPDLSSYAQAEELIEAADYEDALAILEELNREESENPDVLNLLGYASRKLGRIEDAFDYYRQALAIDPLHLGANEYLGELYLETGDIGRAEERLAELAVACPTGCEEREELAEALAAYRESQGQ